MKKKNKLLMYSLTLVIIFAVFLGLKKIIAFASVKPEIEEPSFVKSNDLLIGRNQSDIKIAEEDYYKLPVPLINQMSEPSLKYGCEVTALSMLLHYYQFEYDKNQLQEAIDKEPYQDAAGYLGDPDSGFVGDATGQKAGTGVNVGPIEKLAKKHVEKTHEVVNSSGLSMDELLSLVKEGTPIWVVVTIDYTVPTEKDFMDWQTRNGVKQVTFKHHAAVITGFDAKQIFLNDAYGKEVRVDKHTFNQIYTKMGSQSLYIEKMMR